MKNRNSNGYPCRVHDEKHPQLLQDMPRTRLGVRPEAVAHEVVDDRKNKRNGTGKHQPHGKYLRQQVHHTEINH